MKKPNKTTATKPSATSRTGLKTPSHTQLIAVRATSDSEKSLHPYSHSRLTSMNQCPTFGVVSAQRMYNTTARAMALEAGETMHRVFAAIRVWQLATVNRLPKHAAETGKRIFGPSVWSQIWAEHDHTLEHRHDLMNVAFKALHTTDWYDEPSDNVRTMSNMELATITYIDEVLPYMEDLPIWVEDRKNPKSRVGIEQTFDVVLIFSDGTKIRYIGTIDGLCIDRGFNNRASLQENKTASRMDEGWRTSFDLSNQITGYMATSTSVFGFPVLHGSVYGLKIKPSNRGEDVFILPVSRTEEQILHWGRWVLHTVRLYEQYRDDFENAPRYTHSCNRYFRPCSLVPFCADTSEGRKLQWADMIPADPSPSERAIIDGN